MVSKYSVTQTSLHIYTGGREKEKKIRMVWERNEPVNPPCHKLFFEFLQPAFIYRNLIMWRVF